MDQVKSLMQQVETTDLPHFIKTAVAAMPPIFPIAGMAIGAQEAVERFRQMPKRLPEDPFSPASAVQHVDRPMPLHQLIANCFVAGTGTVFSGRVDEAYLNRMSTEVAQARATGKDKDITDVWETAIGQARAVLASDSIAQRASRSVEFATEGTKLAARHGFSLAIGRDIHEQAPLPFSSATTPKPGRCQ